MTHQSKMLTAGEGGGGGGGRRGRWKFVKIIGSSGICPNTFEKYCQASLLGYFD